MQAKKYKISGNGFTLVEVLVSLSIIVLLGATLAVRFNSLNINVDLDLATEELIFNMRQAHLFSLTGQTSGGIRPDGGWGIRIRQCNAGDCSYFVFADLVPAGGNRVYDNVGDEKMVTVGITDKVYISQVEPATSGVLDIVFAIPQGEVYFNGSTTFASATITISSVIDSSKRQIVIKRDGSRIKVLK